MSDKNSSQLNRTKSSKNSSDKNMSLEEYEEKKKRKLQNLKKMKIEDEKMLQEMSTQNDIAIINKSKSQNIHNPLATNGAKNYEKNRHRLMMKYIMQ